MRTIIVMFIVLGLAASANAQTSTQITATKPSETYKYLKRTLEKMPVGAENADIRKDDKFVPLTSCNTAVDYIGEDRHEKTLVMQLADLAYDITYLQAILRVAGYPQRLWKPDIAEYEKSNLAAIDKFDIWSDAEKGSPAKLKLAKKLNEYKKSTKGRFKDVIAGAEGCGAGEVQVKIRTTPLARVQYINVVKYNLCALQGLDPKGTSCDHWLDYSADAADGALMSGRYKVRATWPDGTTALRDLDVDSLVEGKNGFYSFAIKR